MVQKHDGKISLLQYVRPIMLFSGALPHELVNVNKHLYSFYQYVVQGTFFLYLSFLYFEVPFLHGPIEVAFQSLIILYTYTIMYIKGLVCVSKNMRELIVDMISHESKVKASNNENISDIYRLIVKRSKMVQIFYITLTYSTGTAFVAPCVKYAFTWDETEFNSTISKDKLFPYKMWLPFDEEKHYLIALGLQVYCALIATNYYCYIQSVLVILPLNITFRLKILGNSLRNIDSLRKLKAQNDDKSEHLGDVDAMIKTSIKEHIDIIRNCVLLNDTVKYLMLLEFLLSSAQISLVLIQLTTTDQMNVWLFSLVYLFQSLTQLLLLYWYADEIRGQSVAVCDVVYEMQWYDYKKSINTCIQIMMVRSQKPLSLTVGPFGEMTLAMAVKIIKVAYTYVTFMQRAYGET